MAKKRLCSVDGCGNKHLANGYCQAHYKRLRRCGRLNLSRAAPGELYRFFKNVVLRHETDDCLHWPYSGHQLGYGTVSINNQRFLVTRLICIEKYGPPPTEKHEAAHSCGIPSCCNPRHLRWATPSENQMDKLSHGTDNRGVKNFNAVLTEDQVREIRSLGGTFSQSKIGKMFGVTQTNVGQIIRRKTWKNI